MSKNLLLRIAPQSRALVLGLTVLAAGSACQPDEDEGPAATGSNQVAGDTTDDSLRFVELPTDATSAELPPEAGENDGSSDKAGFLQRTVQSNAEIFNWSANEFDIALKPYATHQCFLTRVSGNLGGNSAIVLHNGSTNVQAYWRATGLFSGGGSRIGGPTWMLGGAQAHTNSLSGEATCVPLSNFFTDAGGVIWQSEGNGAGISSPSWPNCNKTASSNLWNGDALSYLSHVHGNYEGSGEVAEIITGGRNTPSQIRVKTGKCDYNHSSQGRSLFVGTPGVSNMWRYNYSANASSGQTRTTRMMRTNRGVCYFTRISGDFDGAGERVRIFPRVDTDGAEYWFVEAKADRGTAYANAQCALYDQRDGCFGPTIPCY